MNMTSESLKVVLQDQFGPTELYENGCPSCSAEGPVMKAEIMATRSKRFNKPGGRKASGDGGLGYLIVSKKLGQASRLTQGFLRWFKNLLWS